MPNNIVDVIHRLAAASKQGGGITFTDKKAISLWTMMMKRQKT